MKACGHIMSFDSLIYNYSSFFSDFCDHLNLENEPLHLKNTEIQYSMHLMFKIYLEQWFFKSPCDFFSLKENAFVTGICSLRKFQVSPC